MYFLNKYLIEYKKNINSITAELDSHWSSILFIIFRAHTHAPNAVLCLCRCVWSTHSRHTIVMVLLTCHRIRWLAAASALYKPIVWIARAYSNSNGTNALTHTTSHVQRHGHRDKHTCRTQKYRFYELLFSFELATNASGLCDVTEKVQTNLEFIAIFFLLLGFYQRWFYILFFFVSLRFNLLFRWPLFSLFADVQSWRSSFFYQ